MEDLGQLWIDTLNQSALTRTLLLAIIFCSITGFVLYLYIFFLSVYAVSRVLYKRYQKRMLAQSMREEMSQEYASFLSSTSSRRYRESALLVFLRSWFTYENDSTPDLPTKKTPLRKIMSPKTLLGRSTGLSTKKNNGENGLQFRENGGFEELEFEGDQITGMRNEDDKAINYSLNGYERVNLTVVEEV